MTEKPEKTTRKRIMILFALANSPDIDILASWLLTGNPYTYHRLFTHSILFAIIVGAVFSNLSKIFSSFPKLSYKWCYLIIMSHVIADYLISPWKVTFLWPLRVHPGSLNGILDHVDRYATLAREAEVILICVLGYLFMKFLGYLLIRVFRPAVEYLYEILLPA